MKTSRGRLLACMAMGAAALACSATADQADGRMRTWVWPQRIVWSTNATDAARLTGARYGQVPEGEFLDGSGCTLSKKGSNDVSSVILDFGRELHGGVQIGSGSPSGHRFVRLRFGESVGETMAEPGEKGACNDHAIRDGVIDLPWCGSREVGNTGFRFLRIDAVSPGETSLQFVRAVSLMRPYERVGAFRCSDERVNRVWETAVRTVHLCCQEYLWDGIKRDRLVWMGDTHPEMRAILAAFGGVRILPDTLDYAAATTPAATHVMNTMPNYSLWWVRNLHDWYVYSADLGYLRRHHGYLRTIVGRFVKAINGDGTQTWGGFLDWPTQHNAEACKTGTCGLMLTTLLDAKELAGALGDGALAKTCEDGIAKLRRAKPSFAGSKQAAALLALSGLRDPKEAYAEVLGKDGLKGVSTFYGYYMLEAMSAAGENQHALDTVRDFWGAMLDVGATSFWEDFNVAWTNGCTRLDEMPVPGKRDIHGDFGEFCYSGYRHSLCHGWSAGPAAWLIHHVLGARIVAPGGSRVEVKPFLGDLDWAEGVLPTARGPVRIRVEKARDGALKLDVKAPAGVEVVKGAPLTSDAESGCAESRAAPDVTVENAKFKLVIGGDARAKSLVVKATGEEMLDLTEDIPVFSAIQNRPFNNEVKLTFPNTRTEFRANRVRRVGNDLFVGFELISYEAKIRLTERPDYVLFELVDFPLGPKGNNGLRMTYPPVEVMKILNLPVKDRTHFGDWLNVSWDEKSAVSLFAAEPYTWIENTPRHGFRLMTAEAHRGVKLRGTKAVLLASATPSFLDAMDAAEAELDLPRGVRSRRDPRMCRSTYWTADIDPSNVDRHIALAKKGGFSKMLIYHTSVCNHPGDYNTIADYEPDLKRYPKGYESIREMLAKIRAAGIAPGFHFLQTFIGFETHYVTPVADPRLNQKRHFTLAKPFAADAKGDLYVQEDPSDSPTNERSRILAFGGELLAYEGFTTERPYRFTGVTRGAKRTNVVDHPRGQIGGILDVCEFGARSCYIDQNSDLQDEIAEKIAKIYDCGFEFVYNDGSEGVNVPQGIHVANAQYRVWKKFAKKPFFTEGAAKSHFGWHHQAGANAFDVFAPEQFKAMIIRWPFYEAPIMRENFTQVDFGWWNVRHPDANTVGTQMDMWEFGTSKAAAWDCPATIQMFGGELSNHPRADDLLAVMRRWEDVRARKWLTPERRAALKDPKREFHLYTDEKGEYELCEIEMLPTPANAKRLRGFLFERGGKRVVAHWHTSGEGTLDWTLGPKGTVSNLRYVTTDLPRDSVRSAWSAARLTEEVDVDRGRQLFVDDWLISSMDGLVRHWNRPRKEFDGPVLWPETDLERPTNATHRIAPSATLNSGGLWWDPHRKVFRLWYEGGWISSLLYAESKDGVRWTRPDCGVVRGTNRILPSVVPDTWCVYPDYAAEDPYANWRMMISLEGGVTDNLLFRSADGMRWEAAGKAGQSGDCTTFFYDPFRANWVFSLRDYRSDVGRCRRIWTSPTFGGTACLWSYPGSRENKGLPSPRPWLAPDERDVPDPGVSSQRAQLYNVDAVPYESIMLGLFKVFYPLPGDNTDCVKAGLPKITDLQFAYSRDGVNYARPDRTAAIASSRWGSGKWDTGYLSAVGGVCVIRDERLWFHYAATRGDATTALPDGPDWKNFHWRDSGMHFNASIGVASLRRDGFAGLVADGRGTLVTKPLAFTGGHLFVNAECRFGSVRAEILGADGKALPGFSADDCAPVRLSDTTKAELVFRGGNLASLGKKGVRVRFLIHCATLYSFWLSPTARGESRGYVAAGGPDYPGLRDE